MVGGLTMKLGVSDRRHSPSAENTKVSPLAAVLDDLHKGTEAPFAQLSCSCVDSGFEATCADLVIPNLCTDKSATNPRLLGFGDARDTSKCINYFTTTLWRRRQRGLK